MKGYWLIFSSHVKDPAALQEYARRWKPIGEKYGAVLKVLVASALKEMSFSSRVLTVEFDSLEKAQACYDDPAYIEAKAFALRAGSRELVIFEGQIAQ